MTRLHTSANLNHTSNSLLHLISYLILASSLLLSSTKIADAKPQQQEPSSAVSPPASAPGGGPIFASAVNTPDGGVLFFGGR
ncbi:hypothetical protein HK102_010113, partial [Quaeritorhiza haematococci]